MAMKRACPSCSQTIEVGGNNELLPHSPGSEKTICPGGMQDWKETLPLVRSMPALELKTNFFVVDLDAAKLLHNVEEDDWENAENVAKDLADKAAKKTGHCIVVAKPVAWF